MEWVTPQQNRNHRSPAHEANDDVLSALRSGSTYIEIAKRFDLAYETVARKAARNGIDRRRDLSPDKVQEILDDARNGFSLKEIVLRRRVGSTAVHLLAKAHGLKFRGRRLPDEVRNRAKDLLKEGFSQRDVAEKLRINRDTVSVIAKTAH